MKKKYFNGRFRRAAFVCAMVVLAAGAAAEPVQADTYDAVLSGNFTPGQVVTAEIPERESGDSFTGTYKWRRARISGDREPEVVESGQQWGRFSTYRITGEDVGWCIGFSAAGTGKYANEYIGSRSYYVYPLISVELSTDEYDYPRYVATVSTPGYDRETTDNWLQFSYDWYTSDREDGEYEWYSGEVTGETEAWTVLFDTEGARYLKVRVMLDQGESTQEAEAVVELPWEDDGKDPGGGSTEEDGSGDGGNGDGGDGGEGTGGGNSSGIPGDRNDGDISGSGSSTPGSGGSSGGGSSAPGSSDSSGAENDPEGSHGTSTDGDSCNPDDDSSSETPGEPKNPGTAVIPATPSSADRPSGDMRPAVPPDPGNWEPGKPAVSQPPGSGKPGPGAAPEPAGTEAGKQPATPSSAEGSGGGSSGSGSGSGNSRSRSESGENVYGRPLPAEPDSPENGMESLDLAGVPAEGRETESLPQTGDSSYPEVYRITFVVSLMAVLLMVLNDGNERYHRIREMMQRERGRSRYLKERVDRKRKMQDRRTHLNTGR
ncbi:MAG: hypothetical protein HFG62_07205 [Lachnospiraceae bacterium]|nr:hypothetical protein [Lachnospiraceae bacterium]MCI8958888.1 hypothetical protein [Lachnospiraceae bacterium]